MKKAPFNWERKTCRDLAGEDGPEEYYELGYGTYPSIDGSTVCVPMAIEFARQHLGMNDQDAGMFVNFNTTDIAYENLINKGTSTGYVNLIDTSLEEKVVDIILVTEPSDEELAMAKKNNVELVLEPVCFDAFVFKRHKDNPVNSLTVEQIQKIYSGEQQLERGRRPEQENSSLPEGRKFRQPNHHGKTGHAGQENASTQYSQCGQGDG